MFLKQILLNRGIKAVSELSCQLDKSHSRRLIFSFYILILTTSTAFIRGEIATVALINNKHNKINKGPAITITRLTTIS